MSVPKIIHQTGPTDKSKWHPLWEKCQQSWVKNFSDFEYRFWNDEDIDELVKNEYPDYYEMYINFPIHILKIDFFRLCVLHKFGGIYADLDYYCYDNFYEFLNSNVHLVENPCGNDPIENSLMASVAQDFFFLECMKEVKRRYDSVKKSKNDYLAQMRIISSDSKNSFIFRPYLVFYLTGTNLLSSVYRKHADKVSTLPGNLFNNLDITYHPSYKAKHIHTGLWGKENIEVIDQNITTYSQIFNYGKDKNLPINILEYDFYKDYSNGKYDVVNSNVDFEKNNSDPKPITDLNFNYV